MKKNILFAFLLTVFSTHLAAAATNTPAGVPSNLHVWDGTGATFVNLVASGCSGNTYYISQNHVKYDAIMSILLSAQIAQKDVVIRFDGCNTQNQGIVVGVFLP